VQMSEFGKSLLGILRIYEVFLEGRRRLINEFLNSFTSFTPSAIPRPGT
jgi:hypothetical protein